MAHLVKKQYTLPLPLDAELIVHKGKPAARFRAKSRNGKAGKVVVAPLTKDGTRVRMLSRKWYASFSKAEGGPESIPLFTDEVASQQKLAELVRKRQRQKTDLADPFESHRERPIADHLDDYQRFMAAEGNCVEHVAKTAAQIRAIIDGCGFRFIQDLASEKVAEFLHGLRRDPPRPVLVAGKEWFTPAELSDSLGGNRPAKLSRIIARESLAPGIGNGKATRYPRSTVERLQDICCRGVGIATSNSYLTAAKGFSRWLLEKERTDRDRLASLSRLNTNVDRRHARRALGEAELNRLLESAWSSLTTFEGLTGCDRAMVYMLAMTSGLRASELASLMPCSFALTADRPSVTVRAAYTKNQAQAEQPLPADVAAAFREYLQGHPALSALWPGKWNERAAEMLRGDLRGAGIDYRDADGDVADFHALRHSYISLLGRHGASPKVTQTLARHSDIRLTMNVYSHAQIHDLSAAVDDLPITPPGGRPAEPDAMRMTGTDGAVGHSACSPACFSGDASGRPQTTPDEATPKAVGTEAVDVSTDDDDRGPWMTADENYPAWIRTRTKRAKISCATVTLRGTGITF